MPVLWSVEARLPRNERARRWIPRYGQACNNVYCRDIAAGTSAGYAAIGWARAARPERRGGPTVPQDAEMSRVAKMKPSPTVRCGGRLTKPGSIAVLEQTPKRDARGLRDPEGLYHLARGLAHFGREDRAIELLAEAVDRGYFQSFTFSRDAWLDRLRGRTDFREILLKAEQRHQEARAAFIQANGQALLGAGSDRPDSC